MGSQAPLRWEKAGLSQRDMTDGFLLGAESEGGVGRGGGGCRLALDPGVRWLGGPPWSLIPPGEPL